MKLSYKDLGLIDYQKAWDLQKETLQKVISVEQPDTFFLLEHPNTYTLGKGANEKNLVADESFLESNGIQVIKIDRGGDITYHGPGQLVGYPIINLNGVNKNSRRYIWSIEETIIHACKHYGVDAGRNPDHTGVWIENRKICAIGIKLTRWVTSHGFAFNVNTDMKIFDGIIPCGISDKEVTSLEKEAGRKFDMDEMKEIVKKYFVEIFEYNEVINIP